MRSCDDCIFLGRDCEVEPAERTYWPDKCGRYHTPDEVQEAREKLSSLRSRGLDARGIARELSDGLSGYLTWNKAVFYWDIGERDVAEVMFELAQEKEDCHGSDGKYMRD